MSKYFKVYSITDSLVNMFRFVKFRVAYISTISLKLVCSAVELEQLHLLNLKTLSP